MKFNSTALIQSVLTGMGIGFPVTLAAMTAIAGFNSVILEFAVWMAASALFGVLSSVLFHNDNPMPFPAALGLHLVGCFTVTVAACAFLGYSNDPMQLMVSILPAFVAIYVIIYGICLAIMKHNEKKINQALNKD